MSEYNIEDRAKMLIAHQVRNKSHLQEMINFIKVSGFVKVGVANCSSMQKYADKLVDILRAEGINVFGINCRESGLQGCDIDEKIGGTCCDPISQADYLNEQHTDLNINLGLCLGHGLLFQKYSTAPVTTFVVKDAASGHKTIESLG